jgi:hypothetical protein
MTVPCWMHNFGVKNTGRRKDSASSVMFGGFWADRCTARRYIMQGDCSVTTTDWRFSSCRMEKPGKNSRIGTLAELAK